MLGARKICGYSQGPSVLFAAGDNLIEFFPFDGGGSRGYVSAYILSRMMEKVGITDPCQIFDSYYGISVGAVTARVSG
jgi:patatin-like phospholipase/acyl hydrolase